MPFDEVAIHHGWTTANYHAQALRSMEQAEACHDRPSGERGLRLQGRHEVKLLRRQWWDLFLPLQTSRAQNSRIILQQDRGSLHAIL